MHRSFSYRCGAGPGWRGGGRRSVSVLVLPSVTKFVTFGLSCPQKMFHNPMETYFVSIRIFWPMSTSPSPNQDSPRLREWVDDLQSKGRYAFSKDEASRATQLVDPNLRIYLGRLVSKGRLVMPRRGFFVLVPLEYQSQGAPPPSWFIDALMTDEGREYYVAMLSAAAIHESNQPQFHPRGRSFPSCHAAGDLRTASGYR